jgi:hypothetical protein
MTQPVKFPRLRYLDLRGNEIEEFNGLIALQRLKVRDATAGPQPGAIDGSLTSLSVLIDAAARAVALAGP